MSLSARLGIAIEANGQPCNSSGHSEPADLAGEMSDLLVILKNTPLSEEDDPIAFIGVEQREAKRASIGHIGSDVQEILEEPEERKDEPIGLAME